VGEGEKNQKGGKRGSKRGMPKGGKSEKELEKIDK